jgi:hypothetical protein
VTNSDNRVEENKATVRRMLERLNAGDIGGFTSALAPALGCGFMGRAGGGAAGAFSAAVLAGAPPMAATLPPLPPPIAPAGLGALSVSA